MISVREFLRNSHYGRGLAYARLGREGKSIPDFERALELNDDGNNEIPTKLAMARLYEARRENNAAACLAAAEEYEAAVEMTDTERRYPDARRLYAERLYNAACLRAACAAVIPLDPKTPAADATRLAKAEADKAMVWLTKAVAAGWNDTAHMKTDVALSPLRDRADFKKLMTELETRKR